MAPTEYKITALPQLDPEKGAYRKSAISLGQKYRDFRLLALKTSPGAFAATYEDEVKRDLNHTFERLTNPKATQFVAVRAGDVNPESDVTQASLDEVANQEWHGFIGIFGPLEDSLGHVSAITDPFVQMTANVRAQSAARIGHQNSNMSEPMRFHLNGMFVSPAARGMGLGRRLIDGALERAELEARKAQRSMQCTILLDEWNEAAKRLYVSSGFQVIGRERYTKDAKRLAEGESAVDERVALRMQVNR